MIHGGPCRVFTAGLDLKAASWPVLETYGKKSLRFTKVGTFYRDLKIRKTCLNSFFESSFFCWVLYCFLFILRICFC